MAQLTIAQLRERDVERLADIETVTLSTRPREQHDTTDTREERLRTARRLMNSYYRLCALSYRNFHLRNDARRANTRYAHDSEAREQKWFERLREDFEHTFGLTLVYDCFFPSLYPSIVTTYDTSKNPFIYAKFYNGTMTNR